MKTLLIIFALTFTTIGCSNDSDNIENLNIPKELIGKWKITHQYSATGSGLDGTWIEYNSGKAYDLWLKNDGTFTDGNN